MSRFLLLLAPLVLAFCKYAQRPTLPPRLTNQPLEKVMPDTIRPTLPHYDDYAEAWALIDSLEKKGLPKSALEQTEVLYARAKREGNTPQMVKALIYRGKYTVQLEEEGLEKALSLFAEEERRAPEPERSVLQSLLGELFSTYLQNRGWQIAERSPSPEDAGDDWRSWSAEQIELQALRYYRASVANEEVLCATSVAPLRALLTEGVNDSIDGVSLRPTLFDLLAHRALKHFADERSYLTRPAYEFYLDRPEAFAPAEMFVRLDFPGADTNSGVWLGIRLFQRILAVHLADNNTAALIDADLLRLQFVRNHSTLPDKLERYAEALRLLNAKYYNHPSDPEIAYHLGAAYRQLSEQPENAQSNLLQQAVAECESAMARHPKTYGAALCAQLVQQIKSPSLQVQVERVCLPDRPILLSVSFKNIRQLWVRVVALSGERSPERRSLDFGDLAPLPPLEQRLWPLEVPEDFREHRTELRLPPLPVGNYAVLVSPVERFDGKGHPVSYTSFTCSRLAGVSYDFNGALHLAVVDRQSGAPLAGVRGDFFAYKWENARRDYGYVMVGQAITDEDGLLRPDFGEGHSLVVRLSRGDDTLWLDRSFYQYRRERSRSFQEVVFFTDRSLYRPGQAIYFKGVLLERNDKGMPRILPNAKAQVTLYDVNGQPKGRLDVVSNEYGTFNGAFQAPRSGLMGAMSLRAEGYAGQASFSVEEYKRPRFEVTFKPLEGSYRVGEQVSVRGEARNYAGNPVDGAQVRYRVVRQPQIPVGWGGWRRIWPPYGTMETVEIANGTTITAADGSFLITFTALPDRRLPEKDLPTFRYTVMADVTDLAGETRSGETGLVAGYVALQVDWALPSEVELQALRSVALRTTNSAGQDQEAEGTVEVVRLTAPQRRFIRRYWPVPDVTALSERDFRSEFPLYPWKDEDDPARWARQAVVRTLPFRSSGDLTLDLHGGLLTAGYYEVALKTQDAFGKPIEIKRIVRVWDAKDPSTRFADPGSDLEKSIAEPGEAARLWVGGGEQLHFLVLIGREGKAQAPRWLQVSGAQSLDIAVQESDRGGIGINAFAVQHNRFYSSGPHRLAVPWSNKELNIVFETFRDRLEPGERETWRLNIRGPKKEKVAAELVAALYDASLDQFLPHRWSKIAFPFHDHFLGLEPDGFGMQNGFVYYLHRETPVAVYRKYAELDWFDFPLYRYRYGMYQAMMRVAPGMPRDGEVDGAAMADGAVAESKALPPSEEPPVEPPGYEKAPPTPAPIRRNLNETVFFFPQLRTDAEGNVVLQFTMNEALTRWKLLLFAHTKQLQQALEERTVVTQKTLMVLPNPPRFLREGDVIEFTAKVSNLSQEPIGGTATLSLFDALSLQSVEADFGLSPRDLKVSFSAAPGQSAALSWRLRVPEGRLSALTWQLSAESGQHRDGEESTVPVVTNRMLVTETLPLTVRGKQQKTFVFESFQNNRSATLRHHRYTVEFSSNPVWYAVQALPYLMEFPHECSEQIFSRFYANALATHVTQKLPAIRRVYDRWAAGAGKALESNLTKNQELKSALLEETPWVLDALSEEQQKQNIALLFDLQRMADERERAFRTLAERQAESGGWAWFPGGRENGYITQHIVAGLGHLQRLGVLQPEQDPGLREMLDKALGFCHREIRRRYDELQRLAQAGKIRLDDDHLDGLAVHYLYATSFFAADKPDPVTAYYLEQGARYWLRCSLYEQGLLALALHRYKRADTPRDIVASLRERAVTKEELGMYWPFDRGMYWYQLPIETQALLIEVFDEVAGDARAVEEMRIWLLKNKQTNRWESTKATAEAVYALLLRGQNRLSATQPVRLLMGPQALDTREYEPGTGYFKYSRTGGEIRPQWGTIRVENPNPTIAWGAAYWQYFEDLDKIVAFRNTPLSVVKQLYREENTPTGPKLFAITDNSPLKPGDRLRVRLEIRTDRPMEFVHLKDMRAAAFEPVNVISGYRWQDGLGYYESTRDLATHFFIDYLPRGTYVIEYPVVVAYRGDFSSGIATLQCMYAPEFSGHSQGIRVRVE